MKHYLLAGLLLAALPTLGQTAPVVGQEAAQAFKKANVIVIHTTDSASVAYTKLARLLLADGYSIDKSDKEVGYINTTGRVTQASRGVKTLLRFTILPTTQGSIIEERGVGYMSMLGDFPVDFRGAPNSPMGRGWAEMVRVAALYATGQMAYKLKP